MQSLRIFAFPGLSSCLIQSLFILSLFGICSTIESLSTVPTAASANESENETSVPLLFPETEARAFEKENLQRSMKNESESFDMRHTKVSVAEATVDSEDGDTSAESNTTGTNFSDVSTEGTTPVPTTKSSTLSIVTNSTASISSSSITSVPTENESSFADTSTSPISTISDTPTTMPIAKENVDQTTIPSTEVQTDSAESVTAKALTENSGGMPTGIVALVTMVTFALVAVTGYVSLIIWRRYLEYRYGNRELLVNDLEFDTNDLRHFEL